MPNNQTPKKIGKRIPLSKKTPYWMSDSDSSNYNTLLTYKPQTKDYEVMRRKDHLYKYGLIIRYNMDNVKKRWGSAIFFHVHRRYKAPTAGCIASSENSMKQLIEWLNDAKNPSVIISYKSQLCGY